MNERLKELAQQAKPNPNLIWEDAELERFAELVRQDEREARGAVLRKQDAQIKEMQLMHTRLREKFNKAVLDEREACAKLCDEEKLLAYHLEAKYLPHGNNDILRIAEGASRCAHLIRARGNK